MIKRFFWKIWLRLNPLATKDTKSYVAEVSTSGHTLHNSDIARIIVDQGTELTYDTLLYVLNHSDRLRAEKLCEGHNIQTLLCHIAPRVLGAWPNEMTTYDPALHKITLDVRPTTWMRSLLEKVDLEMLGVRPNVAYIGLVTDVTTGLSNGVITPGGTLLLEGKNLKVAPAGEQGLGVFVAGDNGDYPLRLVLNYPKKIAATLPQLPPGAYTLYILTRYVGSQVVLNQPQRIDYRLPLHVADEG
jgi:hypothetical protein